VTAESAVLFGLLTGTAPDFWARMQADHDVWRALQKLKSAQAEPS
jgi:plasmid maintenance system antidote protein VapI